MIFLTGDELTNINPQPNQVSNSTKSSKSNKKQEDIPEDIKIEKTPSLKDTINKINTINKVQDTEKEQDVDKNTESVNKDITIKNDFTQEQLDECYVNFVNKIKVDQPRFFSAMSTQKPLLLDGFKIEIYFHTNAVLEEFKLRLKPTLVSLLKTSLNNDTILIVEKVIEQENMERPSLYTDNEKFQQLVEKNPALIKLKNTFNLDFD